jgi:FixJ family two-component response regulator
MSQGMIAIVDDHEAVRVAMKSLVRSLGYNASTFGSANEFLKIRPRQQHIVPNHRSADAGVERR